MICRICGGDARPGRKSCQPCADRDTARRNRRQQTPWASRRATYRAWMLANKSKVNDQRALWKLLQRLRVKFGGDIPADVELMVRQAHAAAREMRLERVW